MTNTKTYSYKLVVVGDPSVGKTSLIRRYADKKFDDSYLPTIGADFTIKEFELGPSEKVILQIWDMGGHERFARIRDHYYLGANAAFIVFDQTKRATFDHASSWLADIESHCGTVPCLLLANKKDLPNKAVTQEEMNKLASGKNVKILQTSAKTGENVEKIFEVIARECHTHYDTSDSKI